MRQSEKPFGPLATSSSATNDPEPIEHVDPNPDENANTEEPPEPGDIDRESR